MYADKVFAIFKAAWGNFQKVTLFLWSNGGVNNPLTGVCRVGSLIRHAKR